MDKVTTKFVVSKKRSPSTGRVYYSPRIYLPTKLTTDSAFPFRDGDTIVVRIEGRHLEIKRAPRMRAPKKER